MTASSVTGKGLGASKKITTKELSTLANGPVIMISGVAESVETNVSPPANGNIVKFPKPLVGGADQYNVFLTTQNGGVAYIVDKIENGSGEFTGFGFITTAECTVMYMVVKNGIRPTLVPKR